MKRSGLSIFINKNLLRYLYILFLLVPAKLTFAQCQELNPPFAEGEQINYQVYYNWGFIWLDAGWVEFAVKPAVYNNQEVYHLDARGSSHKSYDWLYKVRDRFQVYLQKDDFQPLWFRRQNYEGGYVVDNKYFFDWDKNKAYTFTENSKKPFLADTLDIEDCTLDVLSLIYFFRSINLSGLKENDTIPVISLIDNEIFNLYIRYLGKEVIEDRNKNKYDCIKFSAFLVEGTIFKGGEDLVVWVTNDENKVPVLVEAKILIGSIKAYMESYKGLQYPLKVIK